MSKKNRNKITSQTIVDENILPVEDVVATDDILEESEDMVEEATVSDDVVYSEENEPASVEEVQESME